MKNEDLVRITQFLFEAGTMRKIARMHRQTFFTDDMSDNIATHTFRVVFIGFFLAQMEGADVNKVMKMCLLHDMPEGRSNDHNWIHKRYVTVDDNKIIEEQFGTLPFGELYEVILEYEKRQTKESIIAKDADVLDQIFLMKEYTWQGNMEAQIWLDGKREKIEYNYLKFLKTDSAIALGKAVYDEEPSSWWKNLYQNDRRT